MEQIIADIFATVFLYCRNTGVRRIIVETLTFQVVVPMVLRYCFVHDNLGRQAHRWYRRTRNQR